jgi:LysM repeat protein
VRTSVFAAACAALLAAPAASQQAEPQQVHVVRPGETLWDIARAYLSDPFLWPEIFRLNADVVRDPALIYPDDRLVIPGTRRAADEPAFAGPAGHPDGGIVVAPAPERTAVFPGDFYRSAFVARAHEVPVVGRFVEPVFQSVVEQRMPPQVNLYDRVFVRVDAGGVGVGDRLHFLREGREIRGVGRVWRPTGTGTVAALDDGTATVVVVGMFDRVEPGDVVVPVERFPLVAGVLPLRVESDLQARILGFQETNPLQRTESILFLDAGRASGIAVGDEFEAYVPPERRSWGTRPEVPVARMQVVRVTEGTASVRVTDLEQPRIAVGLPVRRIARMP